MKTIPVRLSSSITSSASRSLFALLALVLVCFGLSPTLQAVSPPPDGGYFSGNTAEGTEALFHLTAGGWNTALGFRALYSTEAGQKNTATGYNSLLGNTTGHDNTADGVAALYHNTTGVVNTAFGSFALQGNTFGEANTAVGFKTLYHNTGNGNIAVGIISHPTFGASVTPAGFNLTTGNDNIDIGNAGIVGESGVIRIGTASACCSHGEELPIHTATYIAGITNSMVIGTQVFVDANGRLGTGPPSSARFKDEIKPMDNASESILALKPVTFRYKKELDPQGLPQFGLVAEEVKKVNPDLVKYDGDGKLQTVRYDAVNAMLLNEFIKEHGKVEKLEATVAQLVARLKEQDSKIEKISNEFAGASSSHGGLAVSASAPRVAANR